MERIQYLIDTNAVIEYLGKDLSSEGLKFMNTVIDNIPGISIITKIEVLGFNSAPEHERLLRDFMSDALIFELDDAIVNVCIDLRKKYKTKLPDAIIAATAIVNDLTLITRNIADFRAINALRLINPHQL